MLSDLLHITFVISILAGMLRIATPLLLAASGELVAERAGVMNMSIEGTMLMGAFAGFLAAAKTGSLLAGTVMAILAGGLWGLLFAFLACTLKVNQIIASLTSNLLSSGLTFYGYRVAFGEERATIPSIKIFEVVQIPYLSKIPFIGEVLFSQFLLSYVALLMVPIIGFFLYRTKYGLQIRSLGENPRAVDMRGVSVTRLQYFAVIFGGMMSGLGGSFLTLASAGLFLPDITAGRGWLAYVIVIAGNWAPGKILIAALAFAFLDSFQLHLQSLGVNFPYQILLALPYVFAILVMAGNRSRSAAPLSLAIPYRR